MQISSTSSYILIYLYLFLEIIKHNILQLNFIIIYFPLELA